jgi:hypothetical protein
MRFLTAVALVMLWVPVDGVAQQPRNPLTGLTTTGHLVYVDWDDDIEGKSEAQFTRELETAFELGLLRTGIKLIDPVEAVDYVYCSVNLLASLDGLTISYSSQTEYREFVVPIGAAILFDVGALEGNVQIASTWDASLVGSVGVNNLSGTALGEWCAEAFELDWRRANN